MVNRLESQQTDALKPVFKRNVFTRNFDTAQNLQVMIYLIKQADIFTEQGRNIQKEIDKCIDRKIVQRAWWTNFPTYVVKRAGWSYRQVRVII